MSKKWQLFLEYEYSGKYIRYFHSIFITVYNPLGISKFSTYSLLLLQWKSCLADRHLTLVSGRTHLHHSTGEYGFGVFRSQVNNFETVVPLQVEAARGKCAGELCRCDFLNEIRWVANFIGEVISFHIPRWKTFHFDESRLNNERKLDFRKFYRNEWCGKRVILLDYLHRSGYHFVFRFLTRLGYN